MGKNNKPDSEKKEEKRERTEEEKERIVKYKYEYIYDCKRSSRKYFITAGITAAIDATAYLLYRLGIFDVMSKEAKLLLAPVACLNVITMGLLFLIMDSLYGIHKAKKDIDELSGNKIKLKTPKKA